MSNLKDIADAMEVARERADRSSKQLEDVANGPIGVEVETDSGPVPTIQEFLFRNQQKIDEARPENIIADDAPPAPNKVYSSQALADAFNPTKGAALVGYVAPFVGAAGRSQAAKNADHVSVRDFGAVGDGLYHPLSEFFPSLEAARAVYPHADRLSQSIDWAAIQAAVSASRAVLIPRGEYVLNDRVVSNAPRRIRGDGMSDSQLFWLEDSEGVGILIQSGGDHSFSSVEQLGLRTEQVAQGTALAFDYSALVGGGGISFPRARYQAQVHSVYIEGTDLYTTNGFSVGVDFISCLGSVISASRINGCAPGENPQSLRGVRFGGVGRPVQFWVSQTAISAWGIGIESVDAEGVYIHNSEIVTCSKGVVSNNAVVEPWLCLSGSHVAAIEKCVELVNCVEFLISGNDLYPIAGQVGDFIGVHILSGCAGGIVTENNFNRPNTTSLYRGVVEDGGTFTSIYGNMFAVGSSVGCVAIDITENAVNTDVGQNTYRFAHRRVRNSSATAVFEEYPDPYSGNLDSIVTSNRRRIQRHILATGASGGPPLLENTIGSLVETISYDPNTAIQRLVTPIQDREYIRRKSAGSWSTWRYVTYQAA